MQQALREIWALQQIDTRIYELERSLAALDTGATAAAELEAAQATYDSAHALLHSIETEIADIDLNSKSTDAKRKDFENRMYSGKVTAAKELDAMQHEVEMLSRNRDKLDTRELELMEEQGPAREAEAAAKAALEEKKRALASVAASFKKEKKRLEAELKVERAKRGPQAEVAAEADFALLRKYDNLRAKIGSVAITAVDGLNCLSCQIHIPDHVLISLKKGEDFTTCESCGRILFFVK